MGPKVSIVIIQCDLLSSTGLTLPPNHSIMKPTNHGLNYYVHLSKTSNTDLKTEGIPLGSGSRHKTDTGEQARRVVGAGCVYFNGIKGTRQSLLQALTWE